MNTATVPASARPRRKIRYLDDTVQKLLLVGLVSIESLLAAILAGAMYWRLDRVIEGNLYRIHLSDDVPVFSQFLQQGAALMGIFAVANLLAVLLVEIAWRRKVHSITEQFRQMTRKTLALDFSADAAGGGRHHVLDLARSHRERERTKLAGIRRHLADLPEDMPIVRGRQRLEAALDAIDALVPKADVAGDGGHARKPGDA